LAYHALVFVHVLSAIVAVGANLTYAVWGLRAGTSRDQLLFALNGIRFIDNRIANPAYAVLLLTGGALVHFSGRSFAQPWIIAALVLFIIVGAVAGAGYSPALKSAVKALEEKGPSDPAYAAANNRRTAFSIATTVLVLVIVGLMVFRPGGY